MRQPAYPCFITAYYPEAWPESQWRRDLEAIKAAGITTVRWGEFFWARWEPEAGRFDWELSDRFLALLDEVGLDLLLCTPTAAVPLWMLRDHPDCLMQDHKGNPARRRRYQGCPTHPGFRVFTERIIGRLAERYGAHPRLVGWQIGNETVLGESEEAVFDYHPHTLDLWFDWLRRRYGSLDALRAAWVSVFWGWEPRDWRDCLPPRPRENGMSPGCYLDWQRFRGWQAADFVHWTRDLLRRVNPGISVGTNCPEVAPSASIGLGQDYSAQARGLDWFATDIYMVDRAAPWADRQLAFSADLMAATAVQAGARFVIMEAQGGPHRTPWAMQFAGGHFGPDVQERHCRRYAQAGAEAIGMFLWRPWAGGGELAMNGVVEVDGSATDMSRALPGIVERCTAVMGGRPNSGQRAVLAYSRDSLVLQRYVAHLLPAADRSLWGWHGLVEGDGLRPDLADDRDPGLAGLRPDELLVLPFNGVMDEPVIAWASAHVAAGGRLVAAFDTGAFDAHGRLRWPRPALPCLASVALCHGYDHLQERHGRTWRCRPLRGAAAVVGVQPGARVLVADDQGQPLAIASADGRVLLWCWDVASEHIQGGERAATALAIWQAVAAARGA